MLESVTGPCCRAGTTQLNVFAEDLSAHCYTDVVMLAKLNTPRVSLQDLQHCGQSPVLDDRKKIQYPILISLGVSACLCVL